MTFTESAVASSVIQQSGSEQESKSWQIEAKSHMPFATRTLLHNALGEGGGSQSPG